MVIRKEKAQTRERGSAKVFDYGIKEPNIFYAEINGRHPLTGYQRNTKIKEVILVVDGDGEIVLEEDNQDKVLKFQAGDLIVLEMNQWNYWSEKTKAKMVKCCAPTFYPEQRESK